MARKSRKTLPDISPVEVKEKIFKTAIYARLSIEDCRDKESGSIKNQISLVKQYIEEKPYLQLCYVYSDNGATGTNFQRPQFNKLMEDIKSGKINCIAVKDLSRFGRNYIETGNYLEKIFPFLGVRFISVNDNYDSHNTQNNSETLIIALKTLMNDIYAKDISAKIKSALEIKQKNGEFIGSYPAYGYCKSDTDKHKLIIDEKTAPIVRNIFKWRLNGMNYNQIANKLNELDIPSPNNYLYLVNVLRDNRYAKKIYWRAETVKNILENKVYLGHMVQAKYKSHLSQGIKMQKQMADKLIIVENTHPAIIDKETFESVAEMIQEVKNKYLSNVGKYSDLKKPENIFKGILVCADCRRRLKRYNHINKAKGYYYYSLICYNCKTNGTDKEQRKYLLESDLIEVVYNTILMQIEVCADIQKVIEKLNQSDTIKTRNKEQQAELTALKQQLSRTNTLSTSIYNDYADGILTEKEYLFIKNKYEDDKNKLNNHIEEILIEQSKHSKEFITENKWIKAINKFKNDKELTREMITTLIEKIEVSGNKNITIIFKYRDEYQVLSNFIKESGV